MPPEDPSPPASVIDLLDCRLLIGRGLKILLHSQQNVRCSCCLCGCSRIVVYLLSEDA